MAGNVYLSTADSSFADDFLTGKSYIFLKSMGIGAYNVARIFYYPDSLAMIRNELERSITEKSASIGVIGLGYVGLPLIVEFGLKGFRGIGFEVLYRRCPG
jgi:hypothetical protein